MVIENPYLIAGIIFVVLICLFGSIRLFLLRKDPLVGMLIFFDGHVELQCFNLHNGWNEKKISEKDFRTYPHLDLKSLKVRNRPIKKGEEIGLDRERMIRVEGTTRNGFSFTVELREGQLFSYSSETMAQMAYRYS